MSNRTLQTSLTVQLESKLLSHIPNHTQNYTPDLKLLCAELRSGRHIQRGGGLGNPDDPNSPVCWLGVVDRVIGERYVDLPHLSSLLNVPVATVYAMITKNDKGYSFSALADELEAAACARLQSQ